MREGLERYQYEKDADYMQNKQPTTDNRERHINKERDTHTKRERYLYQRAIPHPLGPLDVSDDPVRHLLTDKDSAVVGGNGNTGGTGKGPGEGVGNSMIIKK